jgi:thiamine-monophosphate kinase
MEKRTEIQELGEFGLIQHIRQLLQSDGLNDDTAMPDNKDGQLLCSTELYCEGIHFDLSYVPLKHLGYKIVTAGVSDIAAMNGIPSAIMLGLGLSNRFSVEAVEELYFGIKQACIDYNIQLVAGDTTASRAGLLLSISSIGYAKTGNISKRSTAKAHDILCLSGDIGAAFLGLQLLEREKAVFAANPNAQPELDDYDYVVGRQLKPTARLDIIHQLAEAGIVPTAMIDVSDGLASDLLQICRASGCGAHIFEENLPIDDRSFLAATSLNLSPITAALNGGEDYELLFTIGQADYEKIKGLSDIHTVGYMVADPTACSLQMKSGQIVALQAQGFR